MDARLRQRERRTGVDSEAQAHRLRSYSRRGLLTNEQVRLGAFLGDPGALALYPDVEPRRGSWSRLQEHVAIVFVDFKRVLPFLTIGFLGEVWTAAARALQDQGLDPALFHVGGSYGPGTPYDDSPLDGFGWVCGDLYLALRKDSPVSKAVRAATGDLLDVGYSYKKGYMAPQGTEAGSSLLALFEWALSDRYDWREWLGPLPASPLGNLLLSMARSETWWQGGAIREETPDPLLFQCLSAWALDPHFHPESWLRAREPEGVAPPPEFAGDPAQP